ITAPNGRVLVSGRLYAELNVILAKHLPPPPHWQNWAPGNESAVPDPYHFAAAPLRLSGPFVSTTNTRLHPIGIRAEYKAHIAPDDQVFSTFRVPCILMDGLARMGALCVINGEYLPLVAPRSVRRIDLYERTNDCLLAGVSNIQLYATPRESSLIAGN